MVAPTRARTGTGSAYQPTSDAGDLLARMSHEMRTPLNSVIGFATLLRANEDGNLGERELAYVDRIVSSGHHLLGVVGDLLDIARIEAGRLSLHLEPVPLTPLVRTALAGLEERAAARGVTLNAELPAALSWLETDVARLQQVVVRLVESLLDGAAGGAVTVRVDEDVLTGRPMRISVAHAGDTAATGGTTPGRSPVGLGVEIAHALCRLMGYELVSGTRPGERGFRVEL
ncbi:MAG TPA: histidine kinase dimerization/phospho-acceptor domain-containing protein [Gemmatimonadaceae bacterium]|nr:histidine kinase dimerization/phospho-acceptor domain-containing protein [Gemmatimonadaceae bacterium]